MNKVWRVARTEYLNLLRSKAFLVTLFLMPIFMGGAVTVQALVGDQVDLRERRVAVVDGTGRLLAGLQRAAAERDASAVQDDGVQSRPRFLFEPAEADEAQLSARVDRGELFAYLLIDEGVIERAPKAGLTYHTNTPTFDELPRWIGNTLNAELRSLRFQQAGLDRQLIEQRSVPVELEQYGVAKVSATGEVQNKKVDRMRMFVLPFGSMMLLFALVMMSAPALLNTVLEEKIQRISEILISSVSPFELFLGKLLGNVLISWTIFLIYMSGGFALAAHFHALSWIPLDLLAWFFLFQLLALVIYGSIFSAIGAACSEIRDAQSMMMPAMLLIMVPMFVWFIVLKSPDSTFSVAMSLFPPATPFLMLVRLSVPPGPAAWEVALSVALTLTFSLVCVWAAGKVFRIGILAQGQAPSFRRMAQWVFSR
jgi:ABC-type Na+ efflux pump permease subunit